MHDFYPTHMHQGHMSAPQGHATPPHQIHNPTPSYPGHPHLTTLNSAPSYHLSATSTLQSESHHISGRNESPSHYSSVNMQLPPTPNSLVTMVGPNSGNSNSNETSTPAETLDTIAAMPPPPHHLAVHPNSSYSPWSNAGRPLAPISPSEMHHQSLSINGSGVGLSGSGSNNSTVGNSMSNGQMHHISSGLASLHHNNSPFIQQGLPTFSHSATKNFSMPQPYYWTY